MIPQVAAQGLSLSQQQAENLLLYPELLARTVDMLRDALAHRVSQMNGEPGEFIEIRIFAERIVLLPEEEDKP